MDEDASVKLSPVAFIVKRGAPDRFAKRPRCGRDEAAFGRVGWLDRCGDLRPSKLAGWTHRYLISIGMSSYR